MDNLVEKIHQLKIKKHAIILAHYYCLPEVQDIADYTGDSLALSQKAQQTDADIILFAGVHFMAETAKILNPSKKVIIPDIMASCSLAENCSAASLIQFKENYPDYKIVSYINCSAAVKCLSEVIVTSGNALKIINTFPKNEKLIFAPDRNLGAYINQQSNRSMVLYNGACHVHDLIKPEDILNLKTAYPNAKIIAHPECQTSVLNLANFVGSTAAMLKYTQKENCEFFIVVTEMGILYEMKKQSPHKHFIPISTPQNCKGHECEYMKKNTIKSIYEALKHEETELVLDKATIAAAKKPILKMLELS